MTVPASRVKVEELTGWLDYDRPLLPVLDAGQRIDYFEKRVRLVAVNPLRRILATEIIVAGAQSSAVLIFGVSVCCAIEATGKFLTGGREKGQGANARTFHAFLKRYMAPDFQSGTVGILSYGEALWKHYRNGLAHGFAVCHGGFEGNPPEPYFKVEPICGHDSLKINPTHLLDDYAGGFARYLADLRRAKPGRALRTDFDAVFDKVFIKGE